MEDTTGWNQIDQWDVWNCALYEFPTMQDIPSAMREIWSAGVAKVLRAVQAADEGLELERGLKWFLILPKAVFRQARRGGKAGKGQMRRRVNCLVRDDWGGLLDLLAKYCQLAKKEKRKGRQTEDGLGSWKEPKVGGLYQGEEKLYIYFSCKSSTYPNTSL